MKREIANALSISLVLVCVSAVFLVSCTPTDGQTSALKAEPTVYDRVMKSGTIRAAYVVWPPSVILDTKSNGLSGILPDTLREMGHRLGLEIEFTEEVGWGTMIEGLESNRYDLVCTQVWPNSSRAKRADFLEALFYVGVGVYVRDDDHRFDGNLASINSPSVKIATIDGEMSDIIAKTDFPKAQAISLPQLSEGTQILLEVMSGKADVTFNQTAVGERFLRANPCSIRNIIPKKPIRIFPNCMMVKLGEHDLKAMLNTSTLELVNSGFVEALIDKYEEFPNSLYRRSLPFLAGR